MFKKNEEVLQMLESKWLHSHVDSHLVLGFFANRINIGWVLLPAAIIFAITTFSISHEYITEVIIAAFFIPYLLTFSNYQAAAFIWCIMKFCGGLIFFLFTLMGAVITLRGDRQGIIVLCLGIIWFPHIEFIPAITPKQKYVTIGRLVLTIILVSWGFHVGRLP